MRLVGLLLTPRDELVRADVTRWGCAPVVDVPPQTDLSRFIPSRVRDANVMVFGSPRRRWAEVMETLRAACRYAPGYVSLRFYQPTCTIDLRGPVEGVMRFNVCPAVAEYDAASASKAHAVKKAVREGFADLAVAEERAVKGDIEILEAFLAKRKAA